MSVKSEHKWTLKELNPEWPSDWSGWNYLVLEIKTSTPQRFSVWLYTASGPRRIMLQPFGQNVWLRASVPLLISRGSDQSGYDLASTNNRRTDSFWMSIWGPFGDLTNVESLGVHDGLPASPGRRWKSGPSSLPRRIPAPIFSRASPCIDEFGQWAHADWPRKIKSREQLEQELADEEKTLKPGDFGYCEYGGYASTKAKATGFFRVEQIDGKWWFVDPHGHLFLSTGSNGLGGRGGGGRQGGPQTAPPPAAAAGRRRGGWRPGGSTPVPKR